MSFEKAALMGWMEPNGSALRDLGNAGAKLEGDEIAGCGAANVVSRSGSPGFP